MFLKQQASTCDNNNNATFDLRWELRIVPDWHWTDWFPREVAEGVLLVASGISSLVGGPEIEKW
jgi:hypothetical protein